MPEIDNALIVLDVETAITPFSDEDFSLATKSGEYLPRLQLMTSNSGKCKSGDFPINNFAIIEGQSFQDIGKSVDILVVAWRPKALEIGDEILSVYKTDNPEFQRIQTSSEEKDSGCMFGPEFLVWIGGVNKFATFFMGTKSSRRESPNVKAQMHKAVTLIAGECKNKKYIWYSPKAQICSTPFDIPDIEDIKEVLEKFQNPKETEVERVVETENERAR